jgi:alkanesulfonate monooxygenase SsuD/methylene tetrahydromethanopterin reductase-like flavin-dependent oxidoreductase (luciferase family)
MELGVHLPLMEFGHEGQSLGRLHAVVDVARESEFAAVAANDHFVFSTPWLDGPTALAAVIERSGEMALATTISLAALRGPVPLAKSLAALDILSGGRLVAGVGPGSSQRDYDALGVSFEDRWQRFDEAVIILRRCSATSGRRSAPGISRSRTHRWHRPRAGLGAFHCGSEAGYPRQDCAAWQAWETGGSPPPIKPRRRVRIRPRAVGS